MSPIKNTILHQTHTLLILTLIYIFNSGGTYAAQPDTPNKIFFVGKIDAGKSTVIAALQGQALEKATKKTYHEPKKQVIQYSSEVSDPSRNRPAIAHGDHENNRYLSRGRCIQATFDDPEDSRYTSYRDELKIKAFDTEKNITFVETPSFMEDLGFSIDFADERDFNNLTLQETIELNIAKELEKGRVKGIVNVIDLQSIYDAQDCKKAIQVLTEFFQNSASITDSKDSFCLVITKMDKYKPRKDEKEELERLAIKQEYRNEFIFAFKFARYIYQTFELQRDDLKSGFPPLKRYTFWHEMLTEDTIEYLEEAVEKGDDIEQIDIDFKKNKLIFFDPTSEASRQQLWEVIEGFQGIDTDNFSTKQKPPRKLTPPPPPVNNNQLDNPQNPQNNDPQPDQQPQLPPNNNQQSDRPVPIQLPQPPYNNQQSSPQGNDPSYTAYAIGGGLALSIILISLVYKRVGINPKRYQNKH